MRLSSCFWIFIITNKSDCFHFLTPNKKIEFLDGVARVEFDSEAEAAGFVKAVEANPALKPYVRVASETKANEVAKANIAAQAATGIKVGAQTSEMPKPAVAQVAIKAAPTTAQVFAKEAKPDVQ